MKKLKILKRKKQKRLVDKDINLRQKKIKKLIIKKKVKYYFKLNCLIFKFIKNRKVIIN